MQQPQRLQLQRKWQKQLPDNNSNLENPRPSGSKVDPRKIIFCCSDAVEGERWGRSNFPGRMWVICGEDGSHQLEHLKSNNKQHRYKLQQQHPDNNNQNNCSNHKDLQDHASCTRTSSDDGSYRCTAERYVTVAAIYIEASAQCLVTCSTYAYCRYVSDNNVDEGSVIQNF